MNRRKVFIALILIVIIVIWVICSRYLVSKLDREHGSMTGIALSEVL